MAAKTKNKKEIKTFGATELSVLMASSNDTRQGQSKDKEKNFKRNMANQIVHHLPTQQGDDYNNRAKKDQR